MSQEAQVRVTGPSRGVLAAATGALVVLTSAATAFVVLTGTGGVVPATPSLEPLPPAAAPPARPPVVVLPPGALGLPVPAQPDGPRPTTFGGARGTTPFVLAAPPASVGLRTLLPELAPEVSAPAPVTVPAAGPPPAVLPQAGPPTGEIDPKLVRRLEKTLERRQHLLPGREISTDTTEAAPPDVLSTFMATSVETTTGHQWDEQDEREQRHARSAPPAAPAIPAVVTGSRAVPAVPAPAALQNRRVPAVAEQRALAAASKGKVAKPSKKAGKTGHEKAGRKAAARPADGQPGKDRATDKRSAGKSKSGHRAAKARPGGPRP